MNSDLTPILFGNMVNEKSLQNLIPNSERTKEELQEITRKGGIASGEARRDKKEMREWLELALECASEIDPDKSNVEVGMLNLAKKVALADIQAIREAMNVLNNGLNINHNSTRRYGSIDEAQAFIDEILKK